MMRDTGLADRIRAKGVRVVEVAGWKTRGNDGGGYPTFRPIGAIHHHTAGSSRGATPSLSTNIYGRPDVPGPLAQVMQSREPDGRDIAYVIASGKCNHGGVGTWTGPAGTMNSNYESEGLEVEHTGFGTVPVGRHEISARIIAAMLEAPGSSRSAGMCCEHFEYARPLGRKVDFRELSPYTASTFRSRVEYWIGRTIHDKPALEEDEDMPILRFATAGKPERLILGSIVHGWSDGNDKNAVIKALKDAGYKVAGPAVLTAKGYVDLTNSALQGQDVNKTNELLGQIGMYAAAIAQIEGREEERDTASPPS
jgi:hypothetical protein